MSITKSQNSTETLVRHAFGGLKDSQGVPMADHCMRVASGFEPESETWQAAWLHDIIEDTLVDAEYLRSLGYSDHVVDTVLLLTHVKKEMEYPDYIQRICNSGNVDAIAIKIADQIDNKDPRRWIGMSKYKQKALRKKWEGVEDALRNALQETVRKDLYSSS